jgi:hypothetical protein
MAGHEFLLLDDLVGLGEQYWLHGAAERFVARLAAGKFPANREF